LPIRLESHISSAATDTKVKKLALADSQRRALVADLDTGLVLRTLAGHPRLNYPDISPDGRWVATSTFKGVDVKVWDLTAKTPPNPVASFPAGDRAGAHFSRDGRWLMVSDSVRSMRYYYRVGSWSLQRQELLAGGDGAMTSSAGGLLAVSFRGGREARLVDSTTGHDWASLPVPPGHSVGAFGFNHDGSQLAALGGHYLHLWDLRALRLKLDAIRLDWESDAYPALPNAEPRLTVKVDGATAARATLEVVAVPPPRPRRQAKPEEIAAWVARLNDPDGKIRTEAATALEEVGPPALKALDEAATHRDMAVREQAKQVRDRIAVAEALNVHRCSLKLKEIPVADAVKTLADKSGFRLRYASPRFTFGQRKSVTLELDNVSFVEVMDRLCQAAGLVAVPSGPDNWFLQEGKPPPHELISYAGPVRMQAVNVEYQTLLDLQGAKVTSEQLRLYLSLSSQARGSILSLGQPRAVEARDSTGRSLLADSQTPRPQNDFFESMPWNFGTQRTVLLQPPPKRGGKLEKVKLVLPIEIKAAQQDVLTMTDLARAAGKTFFGKDGIRVKVRTAQINNPSYIQVLFDVLAPTGTSFDRNNLGIRLTDARGREHQASWFNLNRIRRSVREAVPETMVWLSASGGPGFAAQLPWAALAPGSLNGERTRLSGNAQFFVQDGSVSAATITLFRFERLRSELAFEFRDVRLP
jgi:hypothetical protein